MSNPDPALTTLEEQSAVQDYLDNKVKRCLLADDGTVNGYLDPSNSYDMEGTTRDTGTAGTGTGGLTLVDGSNLTGVSAGQFVYNVDKDAYFMVLSNTSGTLTLQAPLRYAGTNWDQTDSTTANKLVDSGADFVSAGIEAGMIACLRDLTDQAVITAVDSATQLSVDSDIFPTGTDYTLLPGFEVGDSYEVCTAILNGDNGQVMMEFPKFYYKFEWNSGSPQWYFSESPGTGFSVHKAFTPGGVEKDAIYVGCFEASVDEVTFEGNSLTDYNLSTDAIKSVAGHRPLTQGQRSEFRQTAANRGSGWHQIDWHTNWMLQILMMFDMQSLDSQTALGEGLTSWGGTERDNWVVNTSNRSVVLSGYTLDAGNGTIEENTANGNASGRFAWRGIENPYGNIWKWLDGVNYNDHRVYLCNDPTDYADDTATNYQDTGLDQPASNGWQSAIHNSEDGLIVAGNSGNSSSYICDYYWQNTGWRVAPAGGAVALGALAGFAALLANYVSGSRSTTVGGRVCFR